MSDVWRIGIFLCIAIAFGCTTKPPFETPDLARAKSEAEDWANLMKLKKQAGGVTDEVYMKAVEQYIRAKGAYAGYLAKVQDIVRKGGMPSNDAKIALEAVADTAIAEKEKFIDSAKTINRGSDSGRRSPAVIAGFVVALVGGGMDIWNKTKELDQKSRDAQAASLEQYKWLSIQAIPPRLAGE